MMAKHADSVYRTDDDNYRFRVFRREAGGWDYDIYNRLDNKIDTWSDGAADVFNTKQAALRDIKRIHGDITSIDPGSDWTKKEENMKLTDKVLGLTNLTEAKSALADDVHSWAINDQEAYGLLNDLDLGDESACMAAAKSIMSLYNKAAKKGNYALYSGDLDDLVASIKDNGPYESFDEASAPTYAAVKKVMSLNVSDMQYEDVAWEEWVSTLETAKSRIMAMLSFAKSQDKQSRSQESLEESDDLDSIKDQIKKLRMQRDEFESDHTGASQAKDSAARDAAQKKIDDVNAKIIALKKKANQVKPGTYDGEDDPYSR